MRNAAGDRDCDYYLELELKSAGIKVIKSKVPQKGEVPATISGELRGWTFRRAWYYWVANGRALPQQTANNLNNEFGESVRAGGYAGGLPNERLGNYERSVYHIDTQDGLEALAKAINGKL